jgi:DNA-directed RNA polymerase subunit RPC12/RpoP
MAKHKGGAARGGEEQQSASLPNVVPAQNMEAPAPMPAFPLAQTMETPPPVSASNTVQDRPRCRNCGGKLLALSGPRNVPSVIGMRRKSWKCADCGRTVSAVLGSPAVL